MTLSHSSSSLFSPTPLLLESRSDFYYRFVKNHEEGSNATNKAKSRGKAMMVSMRRWDDVRNDAMIVIRLANGEEYLINDSDPLTRARKEMLPSCFQGAVKNLQRY